MLKLSVEIILKPAQPLESVPKSGGVSYHTTANYPGMGTGWLRLLRPGLPQRSYSLSTKLGTSQRWILHKRRPDDSRSGTNPVSRRMSSVRGPGWSATVRVSPAYWPSLEAKLVRPFGLLVVHLSFTPVRIRDAP